MCSMAFGDVRLSARGDWLMDRIVATGSLVLRTSAACAGRRVVAAQDTTEVNFSGRDRGRRGLGPADAEI